MAKKSRIYAFIDSQNLNLGVLDAGWKLDFRKFLNYLRTKYQVFKAFLFIGYIPTNEKLYNSLREMGYLLIFKPTIKYKEGRKVTTKGNIDAELVLHTMIQWKNFDKAIIVSGDGDFYCLINHLANSKKLKKIITPNKSYSSLLKEFANYIVSVESFKEKVKFK